MSRSKVSDQEKILKLRVSLHQQAGVWGKIQPLPSAVVSEIDSGLRRGAESKAPKSLIPLSRPGSFFPQESRRERSRQKSSKSYRKKIYSRVLRLCVPKSRNTTL